MKNFFNLNKPVFVKSKRIVLNTLLPSVLVATSVFSIQTTFAESTSISKQAPNTYTVKKGDTLWGIAGKFLDKPWQWPKIWVKNSQIKNPHLIYPGDRLLLCLNQNTTLIGKDEGNGCLGIIARHNNHPDAINLSPKIRVESEGEAIQLIPLKDIQTWLKQSLILSEKDVLELPYVIGIENSRLVAGKGQKVYISGHHLTIGQPYSVFKKTAPYILQKDNKNEYVGTELIKVASGIITHIKEGIATLEVTESFDKEITANDLILPQQKIDLPTTFALMPAKNVEGSIIRVLDSIGAATKHSVVTIDQGSAQGVEPGQVFEITQSAGTVKDKDTTRELPFEKVGDVLIFRTFDHLSYGYILNSTIPVKIGSKITPPES